MKGRHWLAGGALAVVLVGSLVAGYRWAPAIADAAQFEATSAQAAASPAPESTPATKKSGEAAKTTGPWLGVQVRDGDGGAEVVVAVPNGPAATAGVQRGDVITALDGTAVTDDNGLVALVKKLKPGDKVTLTALRNGAEQSIAVTLGELPPGQPLVPGMQLGLPDFGVFGAFGGILGDLRDVPADERFDHLRGGSFSYTDKNNVLVEVVLVPGIVGEVTSDTVKLRPNGKDGDVTYRVGPETKLAPGRRANLTAWLRPEDKAIVVARQGSDTAIAVVKVGVLKAPFIQPKPGQADPGQGNAKPRVVPKLGDELRKHLGALERRLDELGRRFDQQRGRPAQ